MVRYSCQIPSSIINSLPLFHRSSKIASTIMVSCQPALESTCNVKISLAHSTGKEWHVCYGLMEALKFSTGLVSGEELGCLGAGRGRVPLACGVERELFSQRSPGGKRAWRKRKATGSQSRIARCYSLHYYCRLLMVTHSPAS